MWGKIFGKNKTWLESTKHLVRKCKNNKKKEGGENVECFYTKYSDDSRKVNKIVENELINNQNNRELMKKRETT